MFTEPNMGLTVWNLLTDLYDHNAQANNLVAIGQHDHSVGKGVQIGSAGLANSAVIAAKIAAGTITTTQISSTAGITRRQLAVGAGFLSVQNILTDTTAVDGVCYVTENGLTVTLPAPNLGALVGVFAFNSTASAPVVVNCNTGGVIIGTGTGNSATSLSLGTSGSFVILIGDGGNWAIIGGQQDTGWQSMTKITGVATPSGGVIAATRRVGEGIMVKGSFQNNTGSPISSTTSIASVNSNSFPAKNQIISGALFISGGGVLNRDGTPAGQNWVPATLSLQTNGTIVPFASTFNPGDLLFIAGSSFIGTS